MLASDGPTTLVKSNKAKLIVWSVWAILTLYLFYCLFVYGKNLPLAEDWTMVSAYTGNEKNIGVWLWSQNNEHRIPLPRLILLVLLKLSGGDFRCGMAFNIFILSGITAYYIRLIEKLKGSLSISDVFFPLILLHLGHWENMFWSWQVGFVLPSVLYLWLIGYVLRIGALKTMRQTVAFGTVALSLPLCGANGILYLLPLLCWLLVQVVINLKERKFVHDGVAWLQTGILVLASVIIVLYTLNYQRPAWNPPSPSLRATVETGAKFFAMAFGAGVQQYWAIYIAVCVLLVLLTVIFLVKGVATNKTAFYQYTALFFSLGGGFVFALAMGWGRAALIPTYGLPARYALLALPVLIVVYMYWRLYGAINASRLVTYFCAGAVLFLIPANFRAGASWRNWYITGADAVLSDLRLGMPKAELAKKHRVYLLHWNEQLLLQSMTQLQQAGRGPFKNSK